MESSNKFTPKDGSIAVWNNDKIDKDGNFNEARPDFTGKLTLNGTQYDVKFWKTVPKSGGEVFLQGNVEPKGSNVASKEAQAKMDAFTIS